MRVVFEVDNAFEPAAQELGWYCPTCEAFNGVLKEDLKECRCCKQVRPRKRLQTIMVLV
jgi:hypothetical protein